MLKVLHCTRYCFYYYLVFDNNTSNTRLFSVPSLFVWQDHFILFISLFPYAKEIGMAQRFQGVTKKLAFEIYISIDADYEYICIYSI